MNQALNWFWVKRFSLTHHSVFLPAIAYKWVVIMGGNLQLQDWLYLFL